MAGERWIFTKSQLEDTPSRKNGIDSDKELTYRQQAANLIQEMGQRLQVTQLCINTAIVYMHRFYMFHPFSKFHRNAMASACLFLAAKVEEQPRKLEHVLKVTHLCLHKEGPSLDTKSNEYLEQSHELVVNENILLQTLGFDLTVDHPHTHVVKTCQLVRATKDLAQTSYFLATNSLHLTTMCLQLKPTLVACVCVHLACRWSSWEIPRSSEGREWYWYMDKAVTEEKLEELTQDFLNILDKCPSKLRKKIMMWKSGKDHKEENYAPSEKKPKFDSPSSSVSKQHPSSSHHHHHHTSSSHDQKPDRHHGSSHARQDSNATVSSKPATDTASAGQHNAQTTVSITSSKSSLSQSGNAHSAVSKNSNNNSPVVVSNAVATAVSTTTATTTTTTKTTLKEYTERKERERQERLAAEKAAQERRERERTVQYSKIQQEAGDDVKRHVKIDSLDTEISKKRVDHTQHNATDSQLKTETGDVVERKIKTEHSQHPEGKVKKSHHGHHHHHKHSGSEMIPGSETKLKIKTDSSLHSVKKESSSPLKLKIKMPKDQSPLQEKKHKTSSPASQSSEQKIPPLKISHSSKIHADGSSSRHEHRSKSHKSRHSHGEQSTGSSGSQGNDGSHSGTNGRSDLKLHISMSALSSRQSSSEKKDKRSHRDHDNSKHSASATSSQGSQHSGHPRTVSELMPQKKSSSALSSRKRQHSPATDFVNDIQPSQRNKVSRSDATMRRSSSNHSLVSMDMSDAGSLSGSGSDHLIETDIPLRTLNPSVNSKTNSPLLTDNPKQTLDHSIQVLQQAIERQKAQIAATPTSQPPAPQFPQMVTMHNQGPVQSLFDIDFLSDDALPPLPGDPPQRPPTPPF